MKKKVFGRKLSMERDTRRALFRALMLSLLTYGKIKTTRAKAQAVVPFVEKVLRKALKANNEFQRREVLALLGNKTDLTRKIFDSINMEFPKIRRLTSSTPFPNRKGDSARMVSLKFADGLFHLEEKVTKKVSEKKGKKK